MPIRFAVIFAVVSIVITEAYPTKYCLSDCHFSQSFDAPVVISEKCNQTKLDFLCQVKFDIDYTHRNLRVSFGSGMDDDRRRSLDENKKPYDYVSETTTINNTQLTTAFFYSCTLADRCEETFLQNHLPKMVKNDFTDLQHTLMDVLTTSPSSSLTCNQALSSSPVKCNGTCSGERNQRINQQTGQTDMLYDYASCNDVNDSTSVMISAAKTPMGNMEVLGREISFQCSKNYCNGDEMIDRVEEIVNKKYVAFYQK